MSSISIKTGFIALSVALIFAVSTEASGVDEGQREDIRSLISGRITCVETEMGTGTIYAGTDNGLYQSTDSGATWDRCDLPGSMGDITDIAISDSGDVFATSNNGLFRKINGHGWEIVSLKRGLRGVASCSFDGKDSKVFIWSADSVFILREDMMERTGSKKSWDVINDMGCLSGTVMLSTKSGIFLSRDGMASREKIVMPGRYFTQEEEPVSEFEESEEAVNIPARIFAGMSGSFTVVTEKGILMIDRNGKVEDFLGTLGITTSEERYVCDTGENIFLGAGREVYVYSADTGSWRVFFMLTDPGDIAGIKEYVDDAGNRWLLVTAGRHFYRLNLWGLQKKEPNSDNQWHKRAEVSLKEVHEMAIEYAEVSPEKIKSWRHAASWKAILPKLSLSYSESYDDNIELYKSSSAYYVASGPREKGDDWGVDLSWDLSDLIWNESQTSIDVRSKLMVQLRDDILEEVTRLYFERKKVLMELDAMKAAVAENTKGKILEKRLRVEELTGYIDALTGGAFSKALRNHLTR